MYTIPLVKVNAVETARLPLMVTEGVEPVLFILNVPIAPPADGMLMVPILPPLLAFKVSTDAPAPVKLPPPDTVPFNVSVTALTVNWPAVSVSALLIVVFVLSVAPALLLSVRFVSAEPVKVPRVNVWAAVPLSIIDEPDVDGLSVPELVMAVAVARPKVLPFKLYVAPLAIFNEPMLAVAVP